MEPRLEGKNILLVIPKDYYDEDQLEPLLEIFSNEGADVRVASPKLKQSVGMRSGKHMPDMLIVDAIEGITGDSYVSDGKGVRQVKGVFHGTILIGGKGARKSLWNEKLLRLLLIDRYKTNMVVGAIGTSIPCLAEADLVTNVETAYPEEKFVLEAMSETAAIRLDDPVVVHERLVTATGPEAIEEFAEAIIPLIAATAIK